MVMSTETAPALVGRRRLRQEPMVKLFILKGFGLGPGKGDAQPGQVLDFQPIEAMREMQLGRARLATKDDLPKPKRRRLSGGDDDAKPQDS